MDIKMPIMNGDIALQKILEYENNNHNKPKPFIVSISARFHKPSSNASISLSLESAINAF